MKKNKKRDPMPPADATPEEIGDFWDTHDLADYWDETEEVEIKVNLKSNQNQSQPDETQPNLFSITEDIPNTALDIVTDLALDSTIPAPIRKNAFKAFDRLCSALIDVPVGALERRSVEKRAESEARIKIRNEITTQIIQQTQVDPGYALRAGHKYAEKIIQEQLNLDKISAIAASELKNSESDNPTNSDMSEPNKEQSVGSTNQGTHSGEEKTIDDYWLNIFATEARPINTEEMQHRFGRVLAGEIRKPGSYSIKAVKILGELDQDIAALFKKLCSMCITFEDTVDGNILDARILPVGIEREQGDFNKYNLSSYQLDGLSQYGLVGSTQNSLYPYNSCIEIQNHPPALPFRHQGLSWVLLPFSLLDTIQEFRMSGLSFSLAGRELLRIVDQEPMPEYTEDLKKFFTEQNLTMVEA